MLTIVVKKVYTRVVSSQCRKYVKITRKWLLYL